MAIPNGAEVQGGATVGEAGPSRTVFIAAAAVSLSLFGVGAAVLTADAVGVREKLLVSNSLFLISGFGAAVCCLYTARRTTGALRRSWMLFTAMGLAWTIGNVIWFVQSLEPVKPFPTVSDLFFVIALVLAAAGLLRFPAGERVKNDRVRLVLDGLLIGSALLFLSNVLVLEEMFARLGPGLGALLLATYPLGDVLLASLALLLLTRTARPRRLDLVLLACGLLVYAVEDTAYALLQSRGEFRTGTPFDLGWIGGYLLVALAALTFSARAPGTGHLRAAADSRLGDVLVNLVVGVAVVAGVWAGIENTSDVVLGVLVLVIFGARQGVLAGDNLALRQDLARLAETDPLTGLANRRRLERELDRLRLLSARYRTALCLAVVDLDHFKRVNDRFGHVVGDEVLRRVAGHLEESFRGEDAVARIGGEEFVVAMLGMGGDDAVARLAGVLQAFAATSYEVGGEHVSVAASAGVAEQHRHGVGFEELYRAADAALRVAKVNGRGRVVQAGVDPLPDPGTGPVDVAIVEEDPVLADLLRHTLSMAGYRCRVLVDVAEAAVRLTASHDRLCPAAILLDIDPAGTDKLEVLNALQQAGVTSHSAVVVLAEHASDQEILRALRAGVADHVAKPFSVPLLVQKLYRLAPPPR